MKKLAIITTHPIQYNAPWFRLLAERGLVKPKVFYTWSQSQKGLNPDPGFDKNIHWDIPLLDGYEYTFVQNISAKPGSHHFKGIINPSLIKEVEQWKPDAILVFGWAFKSHLKCLRHFHKKIPILFRGDSTLLQQQNDFKKFIRTIFLKWVYKNIDFALYVGTQNKLYFKRHGLSEHQLIFIPHAIDNARFSNLSNQYSCAAEKWKHELGISKEEIVIVYAGKFEKIKNIFFIIELAKNLESLPVSFILAGSGPMGARLKQKAYGNKKIYFLPFQNQLNMPVVYRLGDAFILSSKSETWGLSVNEAMASGRAVLVRDTCGCASDLVKDGKNGFLFHGQQDLYNKIKNIITNKSLLKIMGEKSMQIISSYSFISIVEPLELLLVSNNLKKHNA